MYHSVLSTIESVVVSISQYSYGSVLVRIEYQMYVFNTILYVFNKISMY